MSEDKKNDKSKASDENLVHRSTQVTNSLTDTRIGGNFVGGNQITNITFSNDTLAALQYYEFVEKFSVNAAAHISRVAQIILAQLQTMNEDFGLEDQKLLLKFRNMKCSETYKKHFNEHAVYFSVINHIRETDAIPGGNLTIKNIVGAIRNLYIQFFDKYSNGDQIHSAIYGSILRSGFSQEEEYATHTLIFYVVNECGIFNETK